MAPGLQMAGGRPQAPDSGMGTPSVNDLPPEILDLVFVLVHQDLGKGALFKGLRALFMTCKRWNQLALSIPKLWSSIELLVEHNNVDVILAPYFQHLATITTFLERSRNTPLSLTLGFRSLRFPILDHTKRFAESALHLCLDHFQRWRSVSFNFGEVSFQLPPIPKQAVAPFLEHIDIKCYPLSHQESWCMALVAAAPNLRSYFTDPHGKTPVNMPWEQLQRFRYSNSIQPKKALLLLDRAKSLQECYFKNLGDSTFHSFGDSDSSKPRISSTIQTIGISGRDPQEFLVFLSRLDTPNLTNLHVHFKCNWQHYPFPARSQYSVIFPFLSSGTFRLSSLAIEALAMSEDEFIDCLFLSPSLTTLSIRRNVNIHPCSQAPEAITNNVLKSLTYDNSKSVPPCPLLESLTLERCVGADDGVLSDMVQSRHSSFWTEVDRPSPGDVALLRHLDVAFAPDTHLEDRKRLNEFYQDGLRGIVSFGSL